MVNVIEADEHGEKSCFLGHVEGAFRKWKKCPLARITLSTALPVFFRTLLENVEGEVGASANLRCEVTKPGAEVHWMRGSQPLESSGKYQVKQEGVVVELVVYNLQMADSGEYTCDTGDHTTSARLSVQGRGGYKNDSCKRITYQHLIRMILFLFYSLWHSYLISIVSLASVTHLCSRRALWVKRFLLCDVTEFCLSL